MSLEFWRNASSRRRRIITIVIFFLFAILVTAIGVLVPHSAQEAADQNNALNETQQQIKSMNLLHRTAAIFENNFQICLIMFIPVARALITAVLLAAGALIEALLIGLLG